MRKISFKPEFEKVIDSTSMSDAEKLNFILENTLQHYNTSNRCVKGMNYGCSYHPVTVGLSLKESEGCAIGRLLENEDALFLDNLNIFGTLSSIIEYADTNSEEISLPPLIIKYHSFFGLLQSLHDSQSNWNSGGFKEDKAFRVDEFKNLIKTLTD